MNEKILLVEPSFPYPKKSKNMANSVHKNFVPIGLLKLGSYHKQQGDDIKLVRGCVLINDHNFIPDKILITTLFTYWSDIVWETVKFYRTEYPNVEINIGGIYSTLHRERSYFKKLIKKYKIKVYKGVIDTVEKHYPDYSLLEEDIDYHATHMMRGCIRKCSFCGTWKIEPKRTDKNTIEIIKELKYIGKNKIIFYDNNLLANQNIEKILLAFAKLKINNKPVSFESQSGFDGRLLEKKPIYAKLLKDANFHNIRIAWDNNVDDKNLIEKQINILSEAGFPRNSISVFMIYNFVLPINIMIEKIKFCFKWGVQISDCRNRPLDSTKDDYNPSLWKYGQTSEDYFIHDNWTDFDIRLFRKIVRIHNISMRYIYHKIDPTAIWKKMKNIKNPNLLLDFYSKEVGYSKSIERWSNIHSLYKYFKLGRPPKIEIIDSNKTIQENIFFLKRLLTYHKKHNLPQSNLSEYHLEKNLNKYLKTIIVQKKIDIKNQASYLHHLSGQNQSDVKKYI